MAGGREPWGVGGAHAGARRAGTQGSRGELVRMSKVDGRPRRGCCYLHRSPYGEIVVCVPFDEILVKGVSPVLGCGGALGWRWLCTSSSPTCAPPNPPSAPPSLLNRVTRDLINRATRGRSKYLISN